MLEKAQHYIRVGNVKDLDGINELLIEMLIAFSKYDLLAKEQELGYETLRAETYINTKTKKNDKQTKMSDGDINQHSKLTALKKYGSYKITQAKRDEYRRWYELLVSKKIEILALDKKQQTI